jgi:hypothetical protein
VAGDNDPDRLLVAGREAELPARRTDRDGRGDRGDCMSGWRRETGTRTEAEGCPDDDKDGEKRQGKFHIEYVNGKPVTVIDTVVSVCGKVPRPSVAYVLTPKNIDYEWESLKQDFMPLILASVKKAPF